ncbi:MAG TPA: hypothetical protein VNJ12_06085, partial [Candidatus Dormibacteraeota bacterium]|nr:hypothetical protein [Candidatus Dormibacteraeota bacterium]
MGVFAMRFEGHRISHTTQEVSAMLRREFFQIAAASGVAASLGPLGQAARVPARTFPEVKGLTRYVVDFIRKTQYSDIPPDVLETGQIHILDG